MASISSESIEVAEKMNTEDFLTLILFTNVHKQSIVDLTFGDINFRYFPQTS